ncbi:protein-disulfide isomerase [Geoanaerobacter pelophilus]|uniref:Protein-disulfide isomerase n=1 Tax=Geoanaerobacter pelophilus TaxID=60036 RepID=A0ABQ0MNX1_9BACT|nr:TlpA disulfide reductase family protein [Geoanaerobacter pelophilus]GAW68771.1 protein-disulfide isomerase [Geoanaerobacter pelophilus]
MARPTFRFFLMVFCLAILCWGCDRKMLKVGEEPPPVSGRDINGNAVSLEALRGKVVVLFFWTNSCCGDTLKQDLEPVFRRNRDRGVAVIAVNELDEEKEVASIAATGGLSVPIMVDGGSTLAKDFMVFSFPTAFILDRNGILRQKVLGQISASKLEQLIQQVSQGGGAR